MTVGLLSFGHAPVVATGLTISLTFEPDAAANSALVTAANSAASQIMAVSTHISPAITVFITIGFGTINGTGSSNGTTLGNQSVLQTNIGSGGIQSYAAWLTWLQANKNTPEMTTMVNALPAGTNVQGTSSFGYNNPNAKLMGILPPNSHVVEDGYTGVGTSFPSAQWTGALMHEMTEIMGRTSGPIAPVCFSRFTSVGVWQFSSSPVTSYFSVDGGSNKLADFATSGDPLDFLVNGTQDTAISPATDPFDTNVSGTQLNTLSAVDIKTLRIMGYW